MIDRTGAVLVMMALLDHLLHPSTTKLRTQEARVPLPSNRQPSPR